MWQLWVLVPVSTLLLFRHGRVNLGEPPAPVAAALRCSCGAEWASSVSWRGAQCSLGRPPLTGHTQLSNSTGCQPTPPLLSAMTWGINFLQTHPLTFQLLGRNVSKVSVCYLFCPHGAPRLCLSLFFPALPPRSFLHSPWPAVCLDFPPICLSS